ncbi:hypothetical protein, partial [Acetobacter orientalis]|uniref:hypothetical protein n=1 Tax=Acetobacter orientalis TaxID=146474 RepID=UPI0039EABD37
QGWWLVGADCLFGIIGLRLTAYGLRLTAYGLRGVGYAVCTGALCWCCLYAARARHGTVRPVMMA